VASLLRLILSISVILLPSCKPRNEGYRLKSRDGGRFIFINGGESSFGACPQYVDRAAKDFKVDASRFHVEYQNSTTIKSQIDYLRQLAMQKGVAGIAITPVSPGNLAITEELTRLKESGIPVITIFKDLEGKDVQKSRDYFITSDSNAGTALASAANTLLQAVVMRYGNYKVFYSLTRDDSDNSARKKALSDGISKSFVPQYSYDGGDRASAVGIVRDFFMREHADIRLLVTFETYYALYISQQLEKSEALFKKYLVLSFGIDDIIRDLLKRRMVDAAVESGIDSGRTCYSAMQTLHDLANGSKDFATDLLPDANGVIASGAILVIPDSSKIATTIEAPGTRVMTITDYEAYLKASENLNPKTNAR
jgi:ABC-type sugar transport system substrate-binding protein